MVMYTKGKVLVFFLILFASFVINEKAFGFAEFPPKEQTQMVGSFALAGFVGMYSLIIYLQKSDFLQFPKQI
jgi:hypothetical protein